MSVIAIHRIPPKWNLSTVMKKVAPVIAGQFQTLNFATATTKTGLKTCYLRLSERLDPYTVVAKINSIPFIGTVKLKASVPKNWKNIPLNTKPKPLPQKLAKALKIRLEDSPDKVLVTTHREILVELQSKFTRLFNLSRKHTNHQLLDSIARTIFERLKNIINSNPDVSTSYFKLSQMYRKLHPHFGDFQMILSSLKALPNVKVPEITEKELTVVNMEPHTVDNIPFDKVQTYTNKYSVKITKSVLEHIRSLETEAGAADTEEDVARKKVRQELKNLTPYLPSIIRQVVTKHLAPERSPFHRIRIYGEPFMPAKDVMAPFNRKHRAVKISRSDFMYNLLKMNVPPQQLSGLMAMDGTVLGGAKLIIRSSDIPLYRPTNNLLAEMKAVFGVTHEPGDEDQDLEDGDEDEGEVMEVEQ